MHYERKYEDGDMDQELKKLRKYKKMKSMEYEEEEDEENDETESLDLQMEDNNSGISMYLYVKCCRPIDTDNICVYSQYTLTLLLHRC